MELITIFTPTYNRRKLLSRVYKSLKDQTDKDFIWMVIDDGSEDGTGEYIKRISRHEQLFQILYYYKENGGLHTGYNEAISHLKTELCLCCDSDDWLPNNCIERVKEIWNTYKNDKCAGIVGLDYAPNGQVIGSELPKTRYFDLNELYISGKLVGDKKLVVRSDLYKQLPPMKTINREKNFNPNYYNIQISEDYQWISLNENLCYVEYQQDGMSNNIYKQYIDSPNSFIESRKLYLSLKKATIFFKIRHIIHYDAECAIAKRVGNIFDNTSPNRFLSIVFCPIGWMYYLYIMTRKR